MDIMIVYSIIVGLIKQNLNCPSCVALRSPDGQSIMFTISNYPAFPHGAEMEIIITYPFDWLNLSNANGRVAIVPKRLNPNSIKFWQGSIGTAFPHPYIFDDGCPDFGNCTDYLLFKRLLSI